MSKAVVLASSSPYRRELLARLGLAFVTATPAVDESPLPGEHAADLARRLALAKAAAVARQYPEALVIGADQTVDLDGELLGKPGSAAAARSQLARMQGRVSVFHSGLCLIDGGTGQRQTAVETTRVTVRRLSAAAIADYVTRDQPFDCAGSFRAEGLGIALIERIDGHDPNALVGLPLIRLTEMLAAVGLRVIG